MGARERRAKVAARGMDRFRLPRGLALAAVLGPRLARYHDQAAYIVHRVTCGEVADTRIANGSKKGVPLRKVDLSRLFRKGGDYAAVMRALIDHGVLSTDGSYEVGRAAKCYRLGPGYDRRDTDLYVITNGTFLAKLFETEERRHDQEGWQAGHRHQRGHVVDSISIDGKDCIRYTCRDTRAHRNRRLAVDVINSGSGRFGVDPVTGRFYSPITNMKRELRRSLRFKGEPMVELDLANSQPLLLGILASLAWTGQIGLDDLIRCGAPGPMPAPETTARHRGRGGEAPLSPYVGACSRFLRNWSPRPIDRLSLPSDLRGFLAICEAGRVYTHLADVWGLSLNRAENKKRAKNLAMVWCFGGTSDLNAERSTQVGGIFPSMTRFLDVLKSGDYTAVSRVSARLEGDLVLGDVAHRLMAEAPDVPCLTIHDGVMTTPGHLERVRGLMLDAFARFGVIPTIRIKEPA